MPVAADAGRVFPRAILEEDTIAAARALIGARLVRIDSSGVRVARVVEVEAYLVGDLASHARTGRTPRNAAMFGPSGHAYVYVVYGMYECLNVVTEAEGRPAAVLIRAVEPLQGEDLMRQARLSWARRREETRAARQGRAPIPVGGGVASLPARRLARGPGLVCVAMSVGRELDGVDLCAATAALQLRSAPADEAAPRIVSGPRVGIGYAPEPWRSMPLRFRALHGAAR